MGNDVFVRRFFWMPALIGLAATVQLIPACVGDEASAPGGSEDAGGDAIVGGDAAGGDAGSDGCSGTMCGTDCVDLKTSSTNCGACDTVCNADAGIFACVQGACGNKVVQVSAGFTVSCALLLDGSVWCWGGQGSGETGTVSGSNTAVPQKVAGIANAVEVFAGWSTVCARDVNGDVWCWGQDNFGQTGQPIDIDAGELSPTPKKVALPEKAAQLAGNTGTMCARTVGGNVFCWGQNASDMLGLGADVTLTSPTPVQIPIFSSDAIDVSVGFADTGLPGIHAVGCGVRSDKTVWCWGSNLLAELGHAPGGGSPADIGCAGTTEGYNCNPIPQVVDEVDAGVFGNTTKVRAGNQTACALRGDGTIWCWGQNADGELGIGSFDGNPHPVPTLALTNAAQLSTADLTSIAIDTGGAAHGWGTQFNGVLPLGDYSGSSCSYGFTCEESPVALPLLAGITGVSIFFDHGAALKKDGTVVAWGDNNYADLGHATGDAGDIPCNTGGGMCDPTPSPLTTVPWQ